MDVSFRFITMETVSFLKSNCYIFFPVNDTLTCKILLSHSWISYKNQLIARDIATNEEHMHVCLTIT